MVIDALRGYLQLANGLTEVTRQRATAAARALVSQTGASVEQAVPDQLQKQVHGLAEDLVATSRANRDLLVSVVFGEIEKAVARLGLVTTEELALQTAAVQRLTKRVAELEAREEGRAAAPAKEAPIPAAPAAPAADTTPPPRTAPAKKAAPAKTTKKTTPKKAPAAKVAAPEKAAAPENAATKAAAKKATATTAADAAAPTTEAGS